MHGKINEIVGLPPNIYSYLMCIAMGVRSVLFRWWGPTTSPSVNLLATVDDVQARTDHQFTADERNRVAVLCADASAMARSLVPTMPVPAPAT